MTPSLWDWAIAAYARPGVTPACLVLQDTHGQNVPLLLWAAWAAETARAMDEETLEAACDIARAWSDNAVTPLRSLRRTLKAVIPDMDATNRLTLRDQVKAMELEAERHLLTDLAALTPMPDRSPRPAAEGLLAVARLWHRTVPRAALNELSELLSA